MKLVINADGTNQYIESTSDEIVQLTSKEEMNQQKEIILIEIDELKKQLYSTDYKIIKCYEFQLLNLDLPYNIEELHQERQEIRDNINQLEIEIKE